MLVLNTRRLFVLPCENAMAFAETRWKSWLSPLWAFDCRFLQSTSEATTAKMNHYLQRAVHFCGLLSKCGCLDLKLQMKKSSKEEHRSHGNSWEQI